MMAIKMAIRNLVGAGLRTWLNVIVLSFSFVIIIWHKGLLDAWDRQAKTDMIAWDIGGGQYWHPQYDAYDPFSLNDSHAPVSGEALERVRQGDVTPILITQGTIYPSGRMFSVLIKGMDPRQKILALPSARLDTAGSEVPALIGASMASSARLKEGDYVTLRWRDTHGAFDAMEIRIAGVFNTNVPSVDAGQVWLPLEALRHMTLMPGEATLLVSSETFQRSDTLTGWVFKNQKFLLSDFDKIIQSKKASGSILWGILILLAMLAVFDTQVLSIFRRQKEIGTYVAMGMTRGQVVALFTVEGAMHSVLAAIVGAVYGIPFLVYEAIHGLSMPGSTKDFGISMASTIYPVYSVGLVITTVLLILITTVIVSYWPARKIAKMNPTDALRGKIQ